MNETLIILSAFIGFLLFFALVVMLISKMGGWSNLAQKYPAKQFLGKELKTFPMSSLQIGYFGQYSGVVNIKVYPEGIWLRPGFIFKFGHSPIFIKWNDVKTLNKTTFLFTEKLKITLTKGGQITFVKKSVTSNLESLFKEHNNSL